MSGRPRRGTGWVWAAGLSVGLCLPAFGVLLFLALLGLAGGGGGCSAAGLGGAGAVSLGPPGSGQTVGATEYGGPGDPSSGTVGASGANLLAQPDSYAELGGRTFTTATAMGGLPYLTPLRISWGSHSAIAYKRDFGFGGGPIDGHPRVIDLWWKLAEALGIPYDNGLWSGPVRIARPPVAGSSATLGQLPPVASGGGGPSAAGGSDKAVTDCAPAGGTAVPIAPGLRAGLLPDGRAAAPLRAPAAVKRIVAAGNEIVGKPYLYGGGHGLPLDQIAPAYDCSSSVEHLLFGGGLLPVAYGGTARGFESFGEPGPGRWVTIYASASHVFMYVAGLRWDTHDAAGPGDGSGGIGWHPLVRSAAGFVARHPVGL